MVITMSRNNIFQTVEINGQKYTLDYYAYSATFTALANGANQTKLINIESDSDFVVEKIAYMADIGGAVQTDSSRVIPLVNLAINDSGSGRNLQNEPVALSAIAGIGELPFMLPKPRIFRANSTINLTLSNYSAATTYDNIQIVLIGYKRFYM